MHLGKNMAEDLQEILLTKEQIQARVEELGQQIAKDYEGKDVIVICVLKGACVFFTDLLRAIPMQLQMDFMAISSYGNAQKTSGIVSIKKDTDSSITGKDVLIVEDIMDSGLTLNYMINMLETRKPNSIRTCCLLDKPERRECDITPDYCGFSIPNKFVVGYGLDYCGYYRNLPYVGVLSPKVYAD